MEQDWISQANLNKTTTVRSDMFDNQTEFLLHPMWTAYSRYNLSFRLQVAEVSQLQWRLDLYAFADRTQIEIDQVKITDSGGAIYNGSQGDHNNSRMAQTS